jgi:hypothetical protein
MDLEGSVVDQNIEAPKFLDRLRDRLVAEFLAGDVSCDQRASPSFGFNLLLGNARVLVFA